MASQAPRCLGVGAQVGMGGELCACVSVWLRGSLLLREYARERIKIPRHTFQRITWVNSCKYQLYARMRFVPTHNRRRIRLRQIAPQGPRRKRRLRCAGAFFAQRRCRCRGPKSWVVTRALVAVENKLVLTHDYHVRFLCGCWGRLRIRRLL